ncbi:MAG: queuosine precursor transporter [Luteibaculaceae bacterium]
MDKKSVAFTLYLILAGLFIAFLVASNLIFQKFFYWAPFTFIGIDYTFEISVGIIPYPVTFLITDFISEIYGKRKANLVVVAGIFATLFILGLTYLAQIAPATPWSPIDDETFNQVFGFTALAVFASMIAYLLAQFIDIRIYHFWKNLTKGKHLWLRNNFSTITSQLADTATILFLLCSFGIIDWDKFTILLINGFLFKVIVAALDTPVLYAMVFGAKKYFGIKAYEEVEI